MGARRLGTYQRHEWADDVHGTRNNWTLIENQIREAVGDIDIDIDFHLEIIG